MYHFNNVGSTMAVTDKDGVITAKYNYSPYGELIEGEYDENIQFLYNGQFGVITDGNGLCYMRARYYNVDIKRFINQDVLTGTLERISSLNRYSYVEGNPVNYLDPFGLAIAMLQTVVDFASAMVGMLTLLTFIAPQVAIFVNLILWAISLALDMIQMVRHEGSKDTWDELLNDVFWGALFGAAPVFSGSSFKLFSIIGNVLEHELVTLLSTFKYIFDLEAE